MRPAVMLPPTCARASPTSPGPCAARNSRRSSPRHQTCANRSAPHQGQQVSRNQRCSHHRAKLLDGQPHHLLAHRHLPQANHLAGPPPRLPPSPAASRSEPRPPGTFRKRTPPVLHPATHAPQPQTQYPRLPGSSPFIAPASLTNEPALCARTSNRETITSGTPIPSQSPFAAAMPTRNPVNDPGPDTTPIASRSSSRHSAPSNTSSAPATVSPMISAREPSPPQPQRSRHYLQPKPQAPQARWTRRYRTCQTAIASSLPFPAIAGDHIPAKIIALTSGAQAPLHPLGPVRSP